MLTVERSSAARHHTGTMLHHLVRNHIVAMTDYVSGLHEFLTSANDMVMRIKTLTNNQINIHFTVDVSTSDLRSVLRLTSGF